MYLKNKKKKKKSKVVALLNQCSINHSPCAMPMDATANNNNEKEEFL